MCCRTNGERRATSSSQTSKPSARSWVTVPGALVAWFLESVGTAGILRMMVGWADRSAHVVTAVGYCDASGTQVFEGTVQGEIALAEAGANGFGYDPIFVSAGSRCTFVELSDEEKDGVSMRRLALDKARTALNLDARLVGEALPVQL
ncbi:non-canonical purine NTP pyrophosphatase [Streptomyces sp. ME02-8801-2C]|uniref:non-canonical purine NTP pyrophosphatase n=1 Tax=Streptomyces sp. ME02-8801-2C TaxID=3028680 RepID=UPI0029B7EFA2|nr:non-canonical purine NTP pyrophosphatase [Streptomyces sp. ME02-8801-2C]MDX3458572.1 non-canonical purine NTP pyrophosphatase [Streptomyces sp. ME02-8801-2C]